MKVVLTIAGSDSSGGAGIQADLKTIAAHGLYGASAITALTAQNTLGVRAVQSATPDFLADQLDAVFEDLPPHAVKIGMVSETALIEVIADRLRRYRPPVVVVDPVMIATSGSRLLAEDARAALTALLLPAATVITPNIPEAEALSGLSIRDSAGQLEAAVLLAGRCGSAVLVKGGHRVNDANDCLFAEGEAVWLNGERIDNPNTHGTGCTLSSAIACNLALGLELPAAVRRAKAYLSAALRDGLDLGRGPGPLNHVFAVRPFDAPGN